MTDNEIYEEDEIFRSDYTEIDIPLLLLPSDSPPPTQLLPSVKSLPPPVLLLLLDITATFSINQLGSTDVADAIRLTTTVAVTVVRPITAVASTADVGHHRHIFY
nr:hypothetical protein [Tanacetum cinerariifolium]